MEPMLVTHYVKPQGCRPPAENIRCFDHLATHATDPRIGKTEGGDFMGAKEAVGLCVAPREQGEPECQ